MWAGFTHAHTSLPGTLTLSARSWLFRSRTSRYWTQWFNVDGPEDGREYETIENICAAGKCPGGSRTTPCAGDLQPVGIECKDAHQLDVEQNGRRWGGAADQPQYFLAPSGKASCPAGTEAVGTFAECAQAAHVFVTAFPDELASLHDEYRERRSDRPPGCYVEDGEHFAFNEDANKAGQEGASPVCRGEPHSVTAYLPPWVACEPDDGLRCEAGAPSCPDFAVRFECVATEHWTRWFDLDNPSGHGDYETVKVICEQANMCPGSSTPCPQDSIATDVECRKVGTDGTAPLPDFVQCDREVGLTCVNADGHRCDDYEVRFRCGDPYAPRCIDGVADEAWAPQVPAFFGEHEFASSGVEGRAGEQCDPGAAAQVCTHEFGADWEVAPWEALQELQEARSAKELLRMVHVSEAQRLVVTKNGEACAPRTQGPRPHAWWALAAAGPHGEAPTWLDGGLQAAELRDSGAGNALLATLGNATGSMRVLCRRSGLSGEARQATCDALGVIVGEDCACAKEAPPSPPPPHRGMEPPAADMYPMPPAAGGGGHGSGSGGSGGGGGGSGVGAGAAVGLVAALALCVGGACMVYRRRRRKQQLRWVAMGGGEPDFTGSPFALDEGEEATAGYVPPAL